MKRLDKIGWWFFSVGVLAFLIDVLSYVIPYGWSASWSYITPFGWVVYVLSGFLVMFGIAAFIVSHFVRKHKRRRR